jgi:hypothetical protein
VLDNRPGRFFGWSSLFPCRPPRPGLRSLLSSSTGLPDMKASVNSLRRHAVLRRSTHTDQRTLTPCETTLPKASGCARSGYKEQKALALRLGKGTRLVADSRRALPSSKRSPPCASFISSNECAIYLLRSSLRQTSCWVSAITGGTGPKITGPQHF